MPSCSSCGEEVAPTARFCPSCGTAQSSACSACGAPVAGRFCADCGTPVAGAAPPRAAVASSAPAPTGVAPLSERRITSVLFGDLVGFTTLSESRDPDDIRELLSRYFATARTIVDRYGGTVEKFIGDAVMAVWGVPVAHEDDAERAVRAGIDLVDAVAALGEETSLAGLSMRIGVVTGEVAVTLGATGEGMVAGDAVNTAARVQTAAAPGRVWVDDQTRELTVAAVAYDDKGEHELKGKTAPLRLFEVRQVVASVGGARRVDGLEAPFAGRDREVRLVKELFHAAIEDGRPRLVAVYGAPGVGKSRLGWEFEKYTDGLNLEVTMHRGRCLSYGEGVAFWALAEVVRGRFRIAEGDANETVVEHLRVGIETYVPDADDRTWLLPRVATLLGVADLVAPGVSFSRDDLFAAWRTLLEHVARFEECVGAVILIDDLQWADPALLEFIHHVLDHASASIFFLALARPELADESPAFANARRATTLYLDPLPDAPMRELVDGLVDGLPERLRDSLVERSEGLPLFAVETVRALIDRDVVVPKDGRYVFAEDAAGLVDLDDQALPTSLHTLIASRLDGLPPDEQRVVRNAAVLGQTFSIDGLTALLAAVGDDADIESGLAALVRKEIFSLESDPRSSERGQYRFVQAMVRTVAYETLSRRDRKARHLAVARFLAEEPDADAIAAVLASHYLDAHAAAAQDDDATELAAHAVDRLQLAARHARSLGAHVEARRHLDTALTLATDPETVGRLNEAAARATISAGAHAEAVAVAERAVEAYTEAGLGLDAARALVIWGEAQIGGGYGAHAVDRMIAAHDRHANDRAAEPVVAALAAQIARAHYLAAGKIEASLPWFDRAVLLGEALEDLPLLVTTFSSYAGALVISGRGRMGLGLLRVALELARQTGDPVLQLPPLNNLVSFLAARDATAAAGHAEEGIAIVRRLGDFDRGQYLLASAAHVFWNAGRWDVVQDLAAEMPTGGVSVLVHQYAIAVRAARGQPISIPETHTEVTGQHGDLLVDAVNSLLEAAVHRAAGDLVAAAEASHTALNGYVDATGIDDDFPLFWTLAVDDQLAIGATEAAAEMLRPVEDARRGTVPSLQRSLLPWLRGRVAVARGEVTGAAGENYADAAARLREFGAPYYLARCLLDHAELLNLRHDIAGAMPLAVEAVELFTELGAVPWIQRAAQLAGGHSIDLAAATPGAPAGT